MGHMEFIEISILLKASAKSVYRQVQSSYNDKDGILIIRISRMFRQVLEVGIQAELCILLVPHHAHLLVFSNLRQRTRYLLLCPSHRLQEGV